MPFAKAEKQTECPQFQVASAPGNVETFSEIAEALHALAQPLSGLRSAVELMSLLPPTEGERYRKMCATEIERACEMFSCLQGLVRANTAEPNITTFDGRELLQSVLAEQGCEKRAAAFARTAGSGHALIKGDLERTRQAIECVLTVFTRVCGSGGGLEASSGRAGGFLEISFKTRKSVEALNSGNRLFLSMAKANMLCQNGHYHSNADPLTVHLALPLA